MSWDLVNEFHYIDWDSITGQNGENLSPGEIYTRIVAWAAKARGKNPAVFDALTEWVLDDSQWTDDKLDDNKRVFMQGVLTRFREQNAGLRKCLKGLEPSGVVNAPVFKALDIFDDELSGRLFSGSKPDDQLQATVAGIFDDFAVMRESGVRKQIAGNKTGIHGTDSVDVFGYINYLKGSDASVQWALFMPDLVKRQQKGFQVDSFDYRQMHGMRFIGMEYFYEPDNTANLDAVQKKVASALDSVPEHASGFDYDLILTHHFGKGVDAERNHDYVGRFMKAGAPVPEGFAHWDFTPDDENTPYLTFRSQFAFVVFSGDTGAMHNGEGFDVNGMYDVTRNIILAQGVTIPYPETYWTAEAFPDGFGKPGTAFLFSVII